MTVPYLRPDENDLNGPGPRLAESGLGLIPDHFSSAPDEGARRKGQ